MKFALWILIAFVLINVADSRRREQQEVGKKKMDSIRDHMWHGDQEGLLRNRKRQRQRELDTDRMTF